MEAVATMIRFLVLVPGQMECLRRAGGVAPPATHNADRILGNDRRLHEVCGRGLAYDDGSSKYCCGALNC